MFLTTFDKKMYERAVRDEAREAGLEEGRIAGRLEGRLEERTLLTKAHAQRLMENGIPYETARKIVTELSENDFQDIYRK